MTIAEQTTAITAEIDKVSSDLANLARQMRAARNLNDHGQWISELTDFAELIELLQLATLSIGMNKRSIAEVDTQLDRFRARYVGIKV